MERRETETVGKMRSEEWDRRRDRQMTKWEYCSVKWTEATVSKEQSEDYPDEVWRKIAEADDEVGVVSGWILYGEEPQNTQRLLPTLQELGKDGWEMVSHTHVPVRLPVSVMVNALDKLALPSGSTETFYFKRPIELGQQGMKRRRVSTVHGG
jgi:hypothetical protein